MYAAGVDNTTTPLASRYCTDPSAASRAVNPFNVNANSQLLPADAEPSTSVSFTPPGNACTRNSVPGNTPGYDAVSPDTTAGTAAAPTSPYPTACPASGRTDSSSESAPDAATSTATESPRTCQRPSTPDTNAVSIGCHDPSAAR